MIKKQKNLYEHTPLLYDKESIPPSSSSPSSSSSTTACSITSPSIPCTVTLLLSSLIPSLGGFLCGYDQTVMEKILAIPNFHHHYFYGKHLVGGFNPFDYIIFGYFGMAIFGSLYGGYICDQAGRKRSLIGGFLLFAMGTFLDIGCSHSLAFLLGRLFVGIGSGILMVAGPCMITELAPANLRGCLVGFFALLTLAGQLSGYYMMAAVGPRHSASTASTSSSTYGWRTPIMMETCIAFFAILIQWQLPDSPRWLTWISQQYQDIGKIDTLNEGLLAISCLQEKPLNDPLVQQLWKQIIDDCNSITIHDSETPSYISCLCLVVGATQHHDDLTHQPEHFYYQQQRKRRLLLACGLMLASCMTGCEILVKHYASAIFYASGLHDTSLLAANGCTGSLAMAVMAISLGWCVDHFGRKGFLLVGALAMALCHLGLGSAFQWFSIVDLQTGSIVLMNTHARTVAIACIYIFIVIYAFTWGSLILGTTCEWFSVQDRAKGFALVVCLAWSSQWFLATSFCWHFFTSPSLIFYIHGLSMLLSCYFVYCWVPNTTAKALEVTIGMVF
ncbi:major facilitator superfamily domain-containing protein [Absidia repens]|uniref:Major facilitator superfamily domain-containing protein n=1 Tax=Absidia repens TaxID=90262 RepID=A0A1X2ILR0_9FUNG|nr:major facilitator superfamily domain-containing protein [Absidia repens]